MAGPDCAGGAAVATRIRPYPACGTGGLKMKTTKAVPGRGDLIRIAAVLLLSGAAGAACSHEHASPANPRQAVAPRPAKPTLAISVSVDSYGRIWLARVENQTVLVSHSTDDGQHFSVPVAVNA